MLRRAQIYWRIWLKIAQYTLAEGFISKWSSAIFLLGKSMRFGMSLFFLFLLSQNITQIAGYTVSQVIVFFLTYQLLDTVSQVLYRGVYHFSWQVRSGELDFYLSKPLNPLFRILTGKPDLLDAIFFIPSTFISVWIILNSVPTLTLGAVALYFFFLINGLVIATAFHILVISLGVLTTEVDNAIMLFRDINMMSRFPVDIYREPLRFVLFFLVPVGLMNSIPSQVLLNLKPSYSLGLTFFIALAFLYLSLRVWGWSVKRYTSAGG